MNHGVAIFLVFTILFGALFTVLANLYLEQSQAQDACPCEMVRNHECVPVCDAGFCPTHRP